MPGSGFGEALAAGGTHPILQEHIPLASVAGLCTGETVPPPSEVEHLSMR